jgi:hypothetical protein
MAVHRGVGLRYSVLVGSFRVGVRVGVELRHRFIRYKQTETSTNRVLWVPPGGCT